MMEFLKKINTLEGWTLVIAFATLVVTCCAYIHSRKSERKRIKAEYASKKAQLASKQAQLKQLENGFMFNGMGQSGYDSLKIQKTMLETEIEQLKKEL